jgi:extracellular elastinolytic metalloproteinase
MRLRFYVFLMNFLFIAHYPLIAQTPQNKQSLHSVAQKHIQQKANEWHLLSSDVADIAISDAYRTEGLGVTHIYVTQRYKGLEIYNAQINLTTLPNGELADATNRFFSDVATLINTTTPDIAPEQALQLVANHIGLAAKSTTFKSIKENNILVFDKANLARRDITAKLCFFPTTTNGKIRLAWNITIDAINGTDYWDICVDAVTGDILQKNTWTSHCTFHDHDFGHFSDGCEEQTVQPTPVSHPLNTNVLNDGAAYNVFPFPVESPNHGTRSIIVNPADAKASPFGWHDTNGLAGADSLFTRGNNVYAYIDRDGNSDASGYEVRSSNLRFDFPYSPTAEPDVQQDAGVVNLFYVNNMMHDIMYQYGFDEGSGNFQFKNYTGKGREDDDVAAMSQYAAAPPNGGQAQLNNANFSTPPDGSSGAMRMFLWNKGGDLLNITSPSLVAGFYPVGSASFGPTLSAKPITNVEIIEYRDNNASPTLGCTTAINAAQLNGKIAFIDRGDCLFAAKALNAQKAGAVAVIIGNYEDNLLSMGGNPTEPITIPTVLIRSSDVGKLRSFIGNNLRASLFFNDAIKPRQLSSDLDNGIIAHEYTHGISTRLTGGPSNSNCLRNTCQTANNCFEQMGEGWSDFYALALTTKVGDTGEKLRGMGTFVVGQPTTATGIRRYPYSTDMAVNPLTYDDIITAVAPHGIGTVWCSMLWDLYWSLVKKYGWSADVFNGGKGNNIAIQLVMDGFKLQPCDPGFVDGRNAILKADQLRYNGANQCLIWEAFAKRGLGFSASQGFTYRRDDGKEAFDTAPSCNGKLMVEKQLSKDVISAGDSVTVSLKITNFKGTDLQNIALQDNLPTYTTVLNKNGGTIANEKITWTIPILKNGEAVSISYKIGTPTNKFSDKKFNEDFEAIVNGDSLSRWTRSSLGAVGKSWILSNTRAKTGTYAAFVPNPTEYSLQTLTLKSPLAIIGKQPAICFSHYYTTEPGNDGGTVEISPDGGTTWETADFFRNGFRGRMQSTILGANVFAFWGNTPNMIESYIDATKYLGKNILLRFRFGTNSSVTAIDGTGIRVRDAGWYIDDISLIDLYNYQSEACATTATGEKACASFVGKGILVQPSKQSATHEQVQNALNISIYPNPITGNLLNIDWENTQNGVTNIKILSVEGKEMLTRKATFSAGAQHYALDTNGFPSGVYVLTLQNAGGTATVKIVVQ